METYRKITRIEKYLAKIIGEDVELPESPIYREEFYLAKIAGETVNVLPTPITRIDFYLAKIAGESVELPIPITRTDYLLAKVAGEDVETPEYPLSEAEKYLLKWAEGGGYEKTTVTGVSPLVLANAAARAIVSLTQYGKCEQASTPTPDAPVPIMCNNGEIKYGWHDTVTSSALSGYGTYVSPSTTAGNRAYKWLKDLPNGTYNFVVDGDYEIIVQWRDPADPADGVAQYYENLSGWITSGEVTLDKSTGGYGIAVKRTSGTASITPSNFDGLLHVQERGLYVDGTPEVLTVLANQNTDPTIVKATLASANTDVRYNNSSSCIVAPVKPNTTYTIGFLTKPTGGTIFRAATTKTKVTSSVTSVASIARDLDKNDYEPKTFNSGAEAAWMYVQLSNTMTGEDFASIIIQEGTSLTPPQTATAPNLFAVSDYADEVEIISGGVKRKVGIKVFNGTENINTSNACFTIPINDRVTSKTALICSHFPYSTKTSSQTENETIISFSSTNIGFRYDACADKTAFAAWLAAQYAAGTPVIVIYPLAEETTESVTPQPLNTTDGDNVITVTANVDNIQLEVTYDKKGA